MRKLVKEKKNNDKRNQQLLVGGIIIFLLVLSTFGFVFQNAASAGNANLGNSDGQQLTYKGFLFVYNQGFWLAQIGSSVFAFSNNPNDVPALSENVILNPLETYYSNDLHYNSEDDFASRVIEGNFAAVSLSIQKACLEDSVGRGIVCNDSNLPKVDCSKRFISVQVLENKSEGISGIDQEEKCVFIKGTSEEIPTLLDEFFLRIAGIQ